MRLCVAVMVFALFGFASLARATPHERDGIELGGEERALWNTPLAPWLAAHDVELPAPLVTTGNTRGYVGSWELRDGRLYLRAITVWQLPPYTPVAANSLPTREDIDVDPVAHEALHDAFGRDGPIFADWVTETLVVEPSSDRRRHPDYLLVRIERGREVCSRRLSRDEYAGFERAAYDAYRRSPPYLGELAQAKRAAQMPWTEEDQFAFDYSRSPGDAATRTVPPDCD